MSPRARQGSRAVAHLAVGVAMGAALSAIGFGTWDEVHRMFSLADARLHLVFGGTVLLLFTLWRLLSRGRTTPLGTPMPYHRGSIAGGLLFGVGWAVTGACPASVAVQLGEGQGLALATVLGVLLGSWAFGAGQGRIFRFNPGGSCAE